MVDYTKDKFRVGDHVKFDVLGTDLKGTGEILGRGTSEFTFAPMWIVMLDKKLVHMGEEREEKAMIVQECFIKKEEASIDGKYRGDVNMVECINNCWKLREQKSGKRKT